ncbi:hypothetical protein EVAR_63649_1 [Eumeta japonica]|uniref:Uncharacterized protein n=1 Tax=Eumeta variegata TaxID=151549 RepID=A0A4C1ZC52_EUMVA|nr:hypothetical protein EVAR_63649_1 [Eumeta japonica]
MREERRFMTTIEDNASGVHLMVKTAERRSRSFVLSGYLMTETQELRVNRCLETMQRFAADDLNAIYDIVTGDESSEFTVANPKAKDNLLSGYFPRDAGMRNWSRRETSPRTSLRTHFGASLGLCVVEKLSGPKLGDVRTASAAPDDDLSRGPCLCVTLEARNASGYAVKAFDLTIRFKGYFSIKRPHREPSSRTALAEPRRDEPLTTSLARSTFPFNKLHAMLSRILN